MTEEKQSLLEYKPRVVNVKKYEDGRYVVYFRGDYVPIGIAEPFEGFPQQLMGLRRFIDVLKIEQKGYTYNRDLNRWVKSGRFSKPPIIIPLIDQLLLDTVPGFTRGDHKSFDDYLERLYKYVKDASNEVVAENLCLTHSSRKDEVTGAYRPRFSLYRGTVLNPDTVSFCKRIKSFVLSVTMNGLYEALPSYAKLYDIVKGRHQSNIFLEGGEDDEGLVHMVDGVEVPQIRDQLKVDAVKRALNEFNVSSWVSDLPSMEEFRDNREILEKVRQHCKDIPGFEVTYLRYREKTLYKTSSRLNQSPEAFNAEPGEDGVVEYGSRTIIYENKDFSIGSSRKNGAINGYPILYYGPTWLVYFVFRNGNKVVDALRGNEVHIATGEMWTNSAKQFRPDLLEIWTPDPEEIYVVCTHWCQRNGYYWKNKGYIDLYNMWRRRTTLAQWVYMDLWSKCRAQGIELPFDDKARVDGSVSKAKLNLIQQYLRDSKKFTAEPVEKL